MTTARTPRAALHVAAAADGAAARLRAQTVIDQDSAEHQFVGSLLWLTAEQARPLRHLLRDNAIRRSRTRWAYQLIRRLVDAGADPNRTSR